MGRFLIVCLGGAVGTGARFLVAAGIARLGSPFPYGTLVVNLLGSYLIALVFVLGEQASWLSPELRVVLTVGVLGGFTTYSAFSYETLRLLQTGAIGVALANVMLTVVGCLLACWLGWLSGRVLTGA